MQRIGQITGLIVFLFGIALLAFTYFLGHLLLTDVGGLARYAELIPHVGGESELMGAVAETIAYLIAYIVPVLIMFVLGFISSKIAYHGLQMWRIRPATEEKIKEKETGEKQAQQEVSSS